MGDLFRTDLYCHHCKEKRSHVSQWAGLGCFLTVATCGVLLPVTLLIQFVSPHYRCVVCGKLRAYITHPHLQR